MDRFRQTAPLHPELPFVEARIRFASGEVDRAAAQLRTALDTVAPAGLPGRTQGTPTVVSDIAAAANVFAYQGDLTNAAKTHRPGRPGATRGDPAPRVEPGSNGEGWRRMALGELYARDRRPDGVAPAGLAERGGGGADGAAGPAEARRAQRRARAAIGLFTGPAADSSALHEYRR